MIKGMRTKGRAKHELKQVNLPYNISK